jgi:hypothetical protein
MTIYNINRQLHDGTGSQQQIKRTTQADLSDPILDDFKMQFTHATQNCLTSVLFVLDVQAWVFSHQTFQRVVKRLLKGERRRFDRAEEHRVRNDHTGENQRIVIGADRFAIGRNIRRPVERFTGNQGTTMTAGQRVTRDCLQQKSRRRLLRTSAEASNPTSGGKKN